MAGQNTGTGSGVTGESTHGNGVTGSSTARNGVQGSSNDPEASGVYGENTRYGYGVAGRSWAAPGSLTAAVFGDNPAGGPAGIFNGSVNVNGLLTKAGGGFKIDNPADPANSYLCHSFVESPDMTNVYNGNITTDADGNASVALPAYF